MPFSTADFVNLMDSVSSSRDSVNEMPSSYASADTSWSRQSASWEASRARAQMEVSLQEAQQRVRQYEGLSIYGQDTVRAVHRPLREEIGTDWLGEFDLEPTHDEHFDTTTLNLRVCQAKVWDTWIQGSVLVRNKRPGFDFKEPCEDNHGYMNVHVHILQMKRI